MKEQPEEINGIQVVQKIKYLGIDIDNKRNYFKTQKETIIQKARKMANITYSIIEKSCNKLLIGKTFWKSIVLPSILYGINIINISEETIKELQRIENSVYRSILGAAHYAPNVTLRGEIGASLMKRRVISGRMNYIIGLNHGRNQLLETTLLTMEMEKNTKWIKTTLKYLNEVGMTFGDLRQKSKKEIKQQLIQWDKEQWKKEMESKTSLQLYRIFKTEIREEDIYDNRPASTTLYKARTNTLQINDRNRHINKETSCMICGDINKKEDIYHFVLHCTGYIDERRKIRELQQPYLENEENILGSFLFDRRNIERKKEQLHQMWKRRQYYMKILTRQ